MDSTWPSSVHALSVDHKLQQASSTMADHCATFTRSRKIPHTTLEIPWNTPPFPKRPKSGKPYEAIARDARQRLFLDWMDAEDAAVLATGHHADDNVETLILGQLHSPNSMQVLEPCRRWGMGDSTRSLAFAGISGMRKSVIRPLLPFTKDQILATCEQLNLNYIVDQTNFQPDLTPRNRIRELLRNNGNTSVSELCTPQPAPSSAKQTEFRSMALDAATSTELASNSTIVDAIGSLLRVHDLPQGMRDNRMLNDALRASAHLCTQTKAYLDAEASKYLELHRHPSPPSTFALLDGERPAGQKLCRTIIYRILRFVSPFPWGSVASQAHRKTEAADALVELLWPTLAAPLPSAPVTRGALVQWSPVVIRRDGQIKLATNKNFPAKSGDRRGWLASRQPAYVIPGTEEGSDGVLDITQAVAESLWAGGNQHVETLFDCRFLVRICVDALPAQCQANIRTGEGTIGIRPSGAHWYPTLVWRPTGGIAVDISHNDSAGSTVWEANPVREL
ncbi:adenine nucleotide alpha hydrolases-like protein [Exidia glandulosa HHB12029]|uniref:tRNA(Ile)-lysidine synthetase n=1 Tax=Exidia glandulosa HHB12029 TaxID=1314781 RepID=A0A165KDV9_EXIGL|nr:adenine nucleotide alpha hydrolases-like protein [Exidia glandulosa HHB12029]